MRIKEEIREIIFDTETTGFDPISGDKIIEIAAIEVVGRKKTGNIYHQLIHPERDIPIAAFNVHGISIEMLLGKPKFKEIAEDFLTFINGATLIAHNAPFDIKFINHEFKFANMSIIRNKVIDTLALARKAFPGSPATLDALCKRFNISLTKRDKHSAIIDSELLYEVYIALTGGMQNSMVFDMKMKKEIQIDKKYRNKRIFNISEEDEIRHNEFMKKIKNPIWSN